MDIKLHKNARTTPAVRVEIAASTERVCVLAKRYGVTEATIHKWRARQSFEDMSHTTRSLQTTLTPAQEAAVVEPRKMLSLPLDEMLAVTREFLYMDVSRSGLEVRAIGFEEQGADASDERLIRYPSTSVSQASLCSYEMLNPSTSATSISPSSRSTNGCMAWVISSRF